MTYGFSICASVCSGNVPIASGDFERPFSVDLGEGARVLTSEVAKASPPDLEAKLGVSGSRLVVEPLLLNPGDTLEVTALVSDVSEAQRLGGRVAGVSKFETLTADLPSTDGVARRLWAGWPQAVWRLP